MMTTTAFNVNLRLLKIEIIFQIAKSNEGLFELRTFRVNRCINLLYDPVKPGVKFSGNIAVFEGSLLLTYFSRIRRYLNKPTLPQSLQFDPNNF